MKHPELLGVSFIDAALSVTYAIMYEGVARMSGRIWQERSECFQDLYGVDGIPGPLGLADQLPLEPLSLSADLIAAVSTLAEKGVPLLFQLVAQERERCGGVRGLAQHLGFTDRAAALIEQIPSILPLPARGDFLLTDQGASLLEWNVDPCLGGYSVKSLAARFAQVPEINSDMHALLDPLRLWADSIARTTPDVGPITILIRRTHEPFWRHTVTSLKERLCERGRSCVIVFVEDLSFDGKTLWARGQPVQTVLRWFLLDHVLEDFEAFRPLMESVTAHRALMLYGFDSELYGAKQWLAHPAIRALGNKTVSVPEAGDPAELESALRREPSEWVLKPHAAFEGRGVTLGARVSLTEWTTTLARALRAEGGPWIAQRYVPPHPIPIRYAVRREEIPSTEIEAVTLGVFVIDGRYGGCIARSASRDREVVDAEATLHVVVADSEKLPASLRRPFENTPKSEVSQTLQSFSSLVIERLSTPTQTPLPPQRPAKEIARHFMAPLPERGLPLEQILEDISTHLLPYCHDKRGRTYFAHIDVPPADLSIFSGLLIRALAQDPMVYASSRSGTFVEQQVIHWLATLIYPKSHTAGGVATSGGTQANLQALLILRNLAFARLGQNVIADGLPAALARSGYDGVRLFLSEAAHASLFSAARHIGFGDAAVARIPTGLDDRISLSTLEAELHQCRRNHFLPVAVVLTAGTAGVGAIDPLQPAIELARAHGAQVHVDAAHGGMLLFSPRRAAALEGLQDADTVVIDPHKILGLNQGLGALIVRDRAMLDALGKVALSYFASPDTPDLGRHTMDGSRALNALGAWVLLRAFGRQGYEAIVEHFFALTEKFLKELKATDRFALLTEKPEMNLVAFRLKPREPLTEAFEIHSENARNEALLRKLLEERRFAASCYRHSSGLTYLRAVFVNPASRSSDVREFVRELARLADEMD